MLTLAFHTRQVENGQTSVANPPAKGLHAAVIEGDAECVRQHILAGSDLEIIEPEGGSTPLITAAMFGRTQIAELLVEAGADVNKQNRDGSTALHAAAFFCHDSIVSILLAHGADPEVKNYSGTTAAGTVSAPWESVAGIYDHFNTALGPLGFHAEPDTIRGKRPRIKSMIDAHSPGI